MKHQQLLPGSVLGVIGGGQLGRYFVIAARRLGYTTWVLDPDADAPAMQLAHHPLVAAYDDATALDTLADACDAITIEFENVPSASLSQIGTRARVMPPAHAVSVAQDRKLEKETALQHGLQPVPYGVIETADDIDTAIGQVRLPAILKTSRLGYDGKGQRVCHSREQVSEAFAELGAVSCVLEQRIELACEISVVLVRGMDGRSSCFPVAENVHVDGILATSTVPATVPEALQQQARELAVRFADGLDYQGVLAIEFFVDASGAVLFNEMAPRPHNSGHYTLDATVCCQFEQQLRALCALPFASVELLSPVTMLNVLGDSWPAAGEPAWQSVLENVDARLHLYGKSTPRPGRKMGHINCLGSDANTCLQSAHRLQKRLIV